MYIHNFLTNHLVKEFDWSTFAKVIIKHQVAYGVWLTDLVYDQRTELAVPWFRDHLGRHAGEDRGMSDIRHSKSVTHSDVKNDVSDNSCHKSRYMTV